jgi:hypothetical protein
MYYPRRNTQANSLPPPDRRSGYLTLDRQVARDGSQNDSPSVYIRLALFVAQRQQAVWGLTPTGEVEQVMAMRVAARSGNTILAIYSPRRSRPACAGRAGS